METIEIVMQHSEETVQQLAKMQYNVFSSRTKYLLYLLCGLSVLAGLNIVGELPQVLRYILLAVGLITFMNIGISASIKADKTMQAIQRQGGKFPRTSMIFRDKDIFIREATGSTPAQTLEYKQIIRLAEDKEYLYLFITREAAYMVPIDKLKNPQKFKKLVESRTGLQFSAPFNLLTVNLHTLLRSFSKKKSSKRK